MYYYVLYISINRERGKQEEFLNTIDKGETPLAAWHIDLLRPLVRLSKGSRHILTVIEVITKLCW